MGFKEGCSQAQKVAFTIYQVSSEFQDVHDPRLDIKLRQEGVAQPDINRLAFRLPSNLEDFGYMAGGIAFILVHGTLWNSSDMR